jgi:hypothetical protein
MEGDKMPQWEDITTYDRYAKERVPSVFQLKLGGLKVTVLDSHTIYRGIWVLNCQPFYREFVLNVTTKEEAQAKALELVKGKIDEVNAALLDVTKAT